MTGDGAHNRTRTDDLFLTKEVLCQLSYVGQVAAASGDRLVGREGFEPPCLSDLVYSQASRRCSTDPLWRRHRIELRPVVDPATEWMCAGADDGTRTRNLRFTKPLLYQLSYVGATGRALPQKTPFGAGE